MTLTPLLVLPVAPLRLLPAPPVLPAQLVHKQLLPTRRPRALPVLLPVKRVSLPVRLVLPPQLPLRATTALRRVPLVWPPRHQTTLRLLLRRPLVLLTKVQLLIPLQRVPPVMPSQPQAMLPLLTARLVRH